MANKNKESKLIKKIWKGVDFLVPGSMFFRLENWKEKDNSKSKSFLKLLSNTMKLLSNTMITSGLLGMGFFYGANAIEYGSFDYKKWSEIRKERQMQNSYEEQINKQRTYRNQFHKLEVVISSSDEVAFSDKIFKKFDTNKDKKLSMNEFIEKYPKFNYKNSVPFSDYDFNKDKFIDPCEFIKAFPKDERAYPYLFWKY